jgi:hypothetical protein
MSMCKFRHLPMFLDAAREGHLRFALTVLCFCHLFYEFLRFVAHCCCVFDKFMINFRFLVIFHPLIEESSDEDERGFVVIHRQRIYPPQQ